MALALAPAGRAAALLPRRPARASCVTYARDDRANSRKGDNFENSKRRRGRAAHLRSPYDSPLRDGNRDRLIGLLTDR
jgi:hypothetical protein